MEVLERESLLDQLQRMLPGRRGGGRLALVVGEAGIGKTTLVRAFCARVRGSEILWGHCDGVVPPRPFAPLIDIADAVGEQLRVALDAADRNAVFQAVLDLLRHGGPRVVVIEDLHWADDATLDLLRVVGRRLAELRVLVVGTYRDHEVGPAHPLRLALGDLPAGVVSIRVPPLSVSAVEALATGSAVDPVDLHKLTGGNAFFVTEVLAAGDARLPVTVRDAVLARVARLSPRAQEVLSVAAVVGERCQPDLLLEVAAVDHAALGECVSRGLLHAHDDTVSFSHELSRRAVLDTIPTSERLKLHRRTLIALQSSDRSADAATQAFHAVQADDADAVLRTAPAAAEMAANLGAHREAAAQYAAALQFGNGLDLKTRASLLEAHARQSALIDDVPAALASQRAAVACWHDLGETVREAEGLGDLATLVWLAGQGDAAEVAAAAVALLESASIQGRPLARAYAALARRLEVAGQDDSAALDWASRALDLARTVDDEAVAVDALTTMGVVQLYTDDDAGWDALEEAAHRARNAGLTEATARALINLVEAAVDLRRYDIADRYIDEVTQYMGPFEFDLYHRIMSGRRAQLSFARGDWGAAAAAAKDLVDRPRTANPIRVRALTLLGRLGVRRGDPSALALLDDALALTDPTEVQELCPLYAARAEAAWLEGDVVRAGHEADEGLRLAFRPSEDPAPWWWGELAFWAWKAGALERLPSRSPEPYTLHFAGRYREAASAWQSIGCPYEAALALSDSGDAADLREALHTFHALGAVAMARRVRDRLRGMGASGIPRGPRPSTVRNPGRLTTRELEVLGLLGDGLSNADIARRLVLSPKTVDHHVSAVLRKLGVANRRLAALQAARLGLKDGGSDRPT